MDGTACYRILQTRDPRFDGRQFVGVTSTGICCRPICPARTPRLENCRFFASAAAAQEAGFRPCLRCRPETAPASRLMELGARRLSAGSGLSQAAFGRIAALAKAFLEDGVSEHLAEGSMAYAEINALLSSSSREAKEA